MNIFLSRPLAFIDIETTGLDVTTDRVVEVAVIKVYPDMHQISYSVRVNPQMPIPAAATAIHGITNADVADMPLFKDISLTLSYFLKDCDFAGFNSINFDIPLLQSEFDRVGINIDLLSVPHIDVAKIYRKQQPRDLRAAYEHYVGGAIRKHHSARFDAEHTIQILVAQLRSVPHGDMMPTVADVINYQNG